jgi:spore maturation protein CgeB
MNYRIVRITGLYNDYIQQYKRSFPNVKDKTYTELYDHLTNNSFDTASSISKNLKRIGIDAINLFTNVEWLQEQWKKENNRNQSGRELIIEQLKALKPEVIWIDSPSMVDAQWIALVRKNIQSIRIVTGLVCAPYSSSDIKTLNSYDFLFTCTPCLNQEFRQKGMKSYLLYHGFDSDILNSVDKENDYLDTDLLFIGSLYTGGGFHKTRIEYLEEFLSSKVSVKIYGGIDSSFKVLSKISAFYAINFIKKLGGEKVIKNIPLLKHYESYGDTPIQPYSRRLKASIFPSVYGLEQFKLLSKARICFNTHGEIAKRCAGNQRLFEATGVGSCLVTDWKDNLPDLFEPDKEVITYNSKAECIDKIQWLLRNPTERAKIAKAGQERTLRDHNILDRAKQIDQIIRSAI